MMLFGLSSQELLSQLLAGLLNGSFYAILSIGLAIIFGLLNVVNFAHGAQYMMGAFLTCLLLNLFGVSYWGALIAVPILMGLFGIVLERTLISRLYTLDPLYGLLMTFGVTLVIQGVFRNYYGSSGLPYNIPKLLTGGHNLGFMYLPNYRIWVVVSSLSICIAAWLVIEKTRLGSYLRAATENPALTEAFGINVNTLMMVTYGFGVGVAGLAGVLAAPIYTVNPNMSSDLIIVVFAVVVIGGMGSILGSVVTGLGLGLLEALAKTLYPEISSTIVFMIMAFVLLLKPAGLFGKEA